MIFKILGDYMTQYYIVMSTHCSQIKLGKVIEFHDNCGQKKFKDQAGKSYQVQ